MRPARLHSYCAKIKRNIFCFEFEQCDGIKNFREIRSNSRNSLPLHLSSIPPQDVPALLRGIRRGGGGMVIQRAELQRLGAREEIARRR